MSDKKEIPAGQHYRNMIACIRAAIEVNEFMSLLTSLGGRRGNDHATRHESGMGWPRSWVQCEIQQDYLGDLSALLLKCRVLVSGECIICSDVRAPAPKFMFNARPRAAYEFVR